MARVTLTQAGEDVTVGGADVEVIGTAAGGEVFTVVSGNVRFDPSINQGGDTVVLPGLASSYSAYLAGGEVVLTRNDGLVTVRVPIGSAGTTIQFDGGDSRSLVFNSTTNQATLGSQSLSVSATAPTPINAAGGGALVDYDVTSATASVNEGDSGTRQLVFTITLDRAVTAADGPVTLNYQTLNGTANSNSDYVAAAGTVTFAVGQSVATVSVLVNGDTIPEADETFSLVLTGDKIRNASNSETIVATIINDDVAVSLSGVADNLVGSSVNDAFFGANNNLGAGDKITDSSTADSDTLTLALDGSNTLQDAGGFALTNIENFIVTNDDKETVTFDLSSSKGIQTVGSANSSQTVEFNQLTSLAGVSIDDVTGPDADVKVTYQDALLAGDGTTVNVTVNDANFDDVILGGVTTGTTGIEEVVLNVSGTSKVDTLVTALETLTIQGGGNVTLDDALNTTVRTINAANAGSVNVNFSNNDAAGQAVTFTGSAGDDVVRAGLAADTINGGAGDDEITSEGGDDVINGQAGNDEIVLEGAGDVTIDAGADDDTVQFDTASLNGDDVVTLGGSVGDVLAVSQGLIEGNLVGVTGASNLAVLVNTTTDLGSDGSVSVVDKSTKAEGQRAGISVVNLNVAGTGGSNDTLLATDYTNGLTVNLGAVAGTDTVKLGSGNDLIRTASFDNTDVLQGNKGAADTILVTDGASTITGVSQFSGFEAITYSNVDGVADGDDQTLVIDNDNAPTDNATLVVNAAALLDNTKVTANAENLTFDSTAVTAFKVDVTGGAAADNITTNNTVADTVRGNAGNDVITAGGGDTIEGGAGKDNITLLAGANVARGGDDDDTIIIGAGAGNNTVVGDGGNDRIEIAASADLTKLDSIDGSAGTDTISVAGTFVDEQFTGVVANSVEILEARAGTVSNITIGAEAQEGGIRTVILNNATSDVLLADKYTADLLVDADAGGDDSITTGTGNDTVLLGVTGNQTIVTGAGNDRFFAEGATDLDYSDTIKAGAGEDDEIVLDNTLDEVVAAVNLGKFDGSTTGVSGVENFTILGSGQVGDVKVADPDNNVLKIGSSNGDVFADLTVLNIDASNLTDQEDSFRLVIDNNLTDDDVAFKITGSSTTTIVEKLNINVDNNINFIGGSGADILRINGSDAGSTVTFDGFAPGADDVIQQTGGLLQDDGFVGLSGVEVLSGDPGTINAVLGGEAREAGIVRILGTTGNDKVTLAAGFTNPLTVTLNTGADTINGSASTAVVTFIGGVDLIQADDTLSGGSTAGDVITLTEGGSSNLNGVSQVETINIVNTAATTGQVTTLTLDATAAEVSGGRITINVSPGAGDSLNVTSTNNVSSGTGAAAALTVNGGAVADTVQGGGGADIINGNAGDDSIRGGAGNDTVNAGIGLDVVRGELGNDIINGDAGNDTLYGDSAYADFGSLAAYNASVASTAEGLADDSINGGDGNDLIVGGLGGDTLTGGAGADTFLYQTADDSRIFPGAIDNRDVITDFVSGVDKINLLTLADTTAIGQTVRFNGNWNTFGEGQGAISLTGGDAFLDVVYVRESNTLWVDVDNNAVLNGNDLQIVLQGVTNLTAADVNNPHTVTGPLGFVPTVDTATIDQGSLLSIEQDHLTGLRGFDQLQFA